MLCLYCYTAIKKSFDNDTIICKPCYAHEYGDNKNIKKRNNKKILCKGWCDKMYHIDDCWIVGGDYLCNSCYTDLSDEY